MAETTYITENRIDGAGKPYTVRVPQAAPAPTPTPGPTDTSTGGPANSPVRRYTGAGSPPTPGSYGADAATYYDGLKTDKPNTQDIYKEELNKMQAQIDAINNVYTGITAREVKAGEGRIGQTRAANARSGDLGGDFGNANDTATKEFNNEKVAQIERERQAAIAGVLSKVQERADNIAKDQTSLALANAEKKLAYKKELQDTARTDLAKLAGTGVSLDKLSQEEYNNLLTQTGYSPIEFESIYNGAKKAGEKIDYTYHNLGNGRVLRTGKSANGTAVDEKQFDYGVPAEWELKETKGGQLILHNKSTNEIKNAGNFGGGGSTTPVKPPASVVSEFRAKLNDTTEIDPITGEPSPGSGYSIKGKDLYVDPQAYQDAYQHWTEVLKLSANDFLKEFDPAKYINPKDNPKLPTYLRNLKNQSKTSTSGRSL